MCFTDFMYFMSSATKTRRNQATSGNKGEGKNKQMVKTVLNTSLRTMNVFASEASTFLGLLLGAFQIWPHSTCLPSLPSHPTHPRPAARPTVPAPCPLPCSPCPLPAKLNSSATLSMNRVAFLLLTLPSCLGIVSPIRKAILARLWGARHVLVDRVQHVNICGPLGYRRLPLDRRNSTACA